MDKETFVKRMSELAEIKRKALEYDGKEREKATESYIAEACPFKVGKKVKLNGREAIMSSIEAFVDGDFRYKIRMIKKDGTPHIRETVVYSWEYGRLQH